MPRLVSIVLTVLRSGTIRFKGYFSDGQHTKSYHASWRGMLGARGHMLTRVDFIAIRHES